ncbi:MAG: UvrD-helicase domain-containing protein [Oscillospiraceae bacterium]|nr:UvrD-helicase domain-containing protein [Oscillospiraceae bacterium]
MEDVLQGLNAAQYEAATTTEGYVRVLAGAGSGKTRALTRRFAYLVQELGILPGNILCVTFSNKAANEMRRRIHMLTGDNDTGYICTFHSLCVSILQEDSHAVGYPKSFLVLDNSDIDSMLKVIYEERGLTLRDMTFGKARDMFEMEKLFKRPDYYLDLIDLPLEKLKEKYDRAQALKDILFYGYLYQQKKCFGLDYNDLILFSLYIFRKNPDICSKWQQRLEYIMIDEFQDIDDPQYKLMEVLAGYHKNLFVVGDPDQTIYTWRGANGRYLNEFDLAFPGTKTILMMENYRSTPQILKAVNSLIDKNQSRIRKELLPRLPDGAPVTAHFAVTPEDEALWIVHRVTELHQAGIPYHEVTVLYRAHYLTRVLEDVLLKERLPYTIYSGVSFFDRAEIKDALSYLRMLVYGDDLSFRRIANTPKRNLGQKRMKYLEEYAQIHGCSLFQALRQCCDDDLFRSTKADRFIHLIDRWTGCFAGMPASEVLTGILQESGYEEYLRTEGSQTRLDNLAELKQSLYEYEAECGEETTLEHYLTHAALFTGQDVTEIGDTIRLMTVHAAKGLEFPYVFLCGLDEGIFPSRKVLTRPAMEEERRLAFVAMTRAEQALFLSCSGGKTPDGSPRYPSRFLLDIDEAHLLWDNPPQRSLIKETQDYILSRPFADESAAPSAFAAGDRVCHDIFGPGTVQETDLEKATYTVAFDRLETPRRLSFRVKLAACPEEG